MPSIAQVSQFLDELAPPSLAEDWDNVGLLVGDPEASADRIMTCLTVTPESTAEAIGQQTNLIVSHHPLPFRPMKKITTETVATKMIWELIRAGISIYSPHTGYDSAASGINQMLALKFGLQKIRPIKTVPDAPQELGSGRIGDLHPGVDLADFANQVKQDFGLSMIQIVGQPNDTVQRVAVACGSGGSFLSAAIRSGCDTFVTGETTFHTALEAKANRVALVMLGHFASERFAVDSLATKLEQQFGDAVVWASQDEVDPLDCW